MDKGLAKNILIALLVSLTAFSIYKYVTSLREKYELLNTLNQVKNQLAVLEQEKQNLSQELEKAVKLQQEFSDESLELKDYLRASKQRIGKLFTQISLVQKKSEDLESQFSILKTENTTLSDQVTQITKERDGLKTKLSSVTELKKAIRELKKQVYKVRAEIQQTTNVQKIIEGNRGYLMKDGKLTYPTQLKVEVIPAPAKEPAKEPEGPPKEPQEPAKEPVK